MNTVSLQYHFLEQGSSQVKELFGRNSIDAHGQARGTLPFGLLEVRISRLTIIDFQVAVKYFEAEAMSVSNGVSTFEKSYPTRESANEGQQSRVHSMP
jgi:hypothetical protein